MDLRGLEHILVLKIKLPHLLSSVGCLIQEAVEAVPNFSNFPGCLRFLYFPWNIKFNLNSMQCAPLTIPNSSVGCLIQAAGKEVSLQMLKSTLSAHLAACKNFPSENLNCTPIITR